MINAFSSYPLTDHHNGAAWEARPPGPDRGLMRSCSIYSSPAAQNADAGEENVIAPPRPGESKREREGASKEGDAAGLSSRLVPKEYAKGKGRPPAYSYFNMGYQRSS